MTDTTSSTNAATLDYPVAEARPETVVFGPVSYEDSFRWLEEDSEPVVAWQTAQDDLTQAYLTGLPGFEPFAKRLAAIGETDSVSVPKFVGGRWFTQHVPEGQDLAVVDMSDSPTAAGRRIIDLNAMKTDEPLTLHGFHPSPDGTKAIVAWTAGGREEPSIRVIDIDSGAILIDGIPHKRPMSLTWLPDGSGFLYMAMDAVFAGEPPLYRFLLDRPNEVTAEDVTVDHPVARPIPCGDGRHIMLAVNHLAPQLQYILDTQADDGWKPFLKGMPGIFRGDILGDNFIAITDDGAPRGRLVSIPLATPTDRATWKEIVPASDNMVGTVVVTGGRIVLLDLVDTYARLRVFAADGTFEGEIALPGRGTVNSFSSYYVMFTMIDPLGSAEDGQLIFIFSSFGASPALYRADVATRQVIRLTEPKKVMDVQVLDLAGTSADGARITYHAVARKGLDLSTPQPTLIYGYGGFNVSITPGWLGTKFAAWIEAGGVVALAHLRGGGEYGTPWWEQGRMKLKQNSFNDVHAIAEDLIARGISSPDHLGVIGGSNGGVMACAVVVQRPDLYRASVPQVPISDLLGRVRDQVTMVSTLDYGDPADPEMAEILFAWSPYQNVRDDVAYPALLIDCGANDPRCPPWHSRKFAARVQQAHVGDRPILLRVRAAAGHGAVGGTQKAQQSAEVLAFFAEQLGLEVA